MQDFELLKNEFKICDYQEADFDELMQLWIHTGLGNPKRGDDHNVIVRTIEIGGKLLLLKSIVENKIVGSSWITTDGRRSYLHHFSLLPEFQGKSLAKLLMVESMKFAQQLGLQIKLEVHKSNYKAIDLYKKYGFKSLGEYQVFIIRDIENLTNKILD
jgi:ribosomal protein S18 acetylase RimI-like enzyme